ncbi:type IVB secretion system protein IcmH/DotU [Pseudomonas aeruginosa]|uniref:type IVB secretion system protein IcmH/DotU n=1 Tax=Pseudomonas aeruginosa TaxID=287 RepID=UPI000940866B|nr:type IVB secretion system protein IcmH/DotU [Pseudomonas aeruginosa]MBK1492734.1 type IVB secretion system protein IcmH/DotU [Pseudomonas aeruginosa]MCO3840198.1 DotU family type IV/VI secretion system protein [Pseudomonas aeruginosa]MCT4978691.1 type IVB secretion system protein IcmH/DotU [Pseudomonas aeruginosa]MDF5835530.1 type IVB secretion system protein IcmH/DotU [Pseudomonas aeruginosa]MDF5864632.1 type IVB secretion system protein IcmH/DotU [Pseudomonas aeruginosa]
MTTEVTLSNDRVRPARVTTPPEIAGKRELAYEHIHQLDHDQDLGFALRGHSINPLIDAAQPLLGLVIRLRRLHQYDGVESLYETVRDQITSISEEVRQHGYDSATLLAYRYALCAFIDEAVMATPWGSQDSLWSQRSLLSYHHNETWGGEKFFTVLARMQMDPEKYRHVLEFKYLCLCLGFKGKYGRQHDQNETLNAIIAKLHRVLSPLRGDTAERLTDAHHNVAHQRQRLGRTIPLWAPWAMALIVLAGAYTFFEVKLSRSTDQVLHALDNILKP